MIPKTNVEDFMMMMMMMMNQTSSKNLLLCLLLYLICEDGKDDKDEVKTIHRSACRLVSPKAFLCIIRYRRLCRR